MGRNRKNPVKCPDCKHQGSLAIKKPAGIVVWHYDKRKKRGRGMRSCYLGSANFKVDKILQPYASGLKKHELETLEQKLKDLLKPFKAKSPLLDPQGLADVVKKLTELKEHHQLELDKNTFEHQTVPMHVNCPNCNHKIRAWGEFYGVQKSGKAKVWYEPAPHWQKK